MTQQHYICTGECGGVSEKPGVCQDSSCSQHGEPLTPCECDNPENHTAHATENDNTENTQ